MKFDLGEVISWGVQFTWKQKLLWVLGGLPTLLGFLYLPFAVIPAFLNNRQFQEGLALFSEPFFIVFSVLLALCIAGLYLIVHAWVSAVLTEAVAEVEAGAIPLTWRTLLTKSRPYIWRMLGVLLATSVGLFGIYTALMLLMTAFGVLTAGIGFICIQPFLILLLPVMLLVIAFIEQSQAAVVMDDLGVKQAIIQGWQIVRQNLWQFALLAVVVYFGLTALSSLLMIPLFVPFMLLPIILQNVQTTRLDPQTVSLIFAGLGLFLLPIMAFLQGVTMTFLKATFAHAYSVLKQSQAPETIALSEPVS